MTTIHSDRCGQDVDEVDYDVDMCRACYLEDSQCLRAEMAVERKIGPIFDAEELEALMEAMLFDGEVEATDGCIVEPDGYCTYGCPSMWLLLGLI